MVDREGLARNVVLYRHYQACRGAMFTLPVFFLYLKSVVGFADVLVLEAIYYACVVVLEVPSGWLADRFGRRPCLVAGAVLGVAAHVTFVLANGFVGLAVAQAMLAGWMAFHSGADTALLYDSLVALDRTEEVGRAEAHAQTAGFVTAAFAAAIAGAAGGFDLRWPYLLTAGTQVLALVVTLRMIEPPVQATEVGLGGQVAACVRAFSDRALAWVLLFVIAVTILNHVPYELYQAWLDELLRDGESSGRWTPLLSGALLATTMLLGAAVSRVAVRIGERIGTVTALVGTVGLQTAAIASLGLWLHPLAGVAILLRSAPRAIQTPLLRALVHPRLPGRLRSTFFSLLSLAGRLGFSASLLVAATAVGGDATASWATLSATLLGFAVLGVVLTALLGAWAPAVRGDENDRSPELT